jgi:hypothetical protein
MSPAVLHRTILQAVRPVQEGRVLQDAREAGMPVLGVRVLLLHAMRGRSDELL